MGWCLPEISPAAVQELLGKIGVREIREVRHTAKFEEFLSEHSPEVLERKLDEITEILLK
jgi:phosphoribosylformylglycinamidine (FGAM) synthase PurS component